ncbi:hypothetical protein ACM9HF_17805 [Colwellia sp. RE-S-Sl-9]
MYISNNEAFIKIGLATKTFYYDELFLAEPEQRYVEYLAQHITFYSFVCGICDVKTPINGSQCSPKRIRGLCEIQISYPSFIASDNYGNPPPLVNLIISDFTENISSELIGSLVSPIDGGINYEAYLFDSYVHLPQFLKLVNDAGVDINLMFLEEIISNDQSFLELKRLSKESEQTFNFKKAAKKYIKYLPKVSEELIIQACEYASAKYDRINKGKVVLSLQSEVDRMAEALFNTENVQNNNLNNNTVIKSPSTRETDNLYKTIGLLTKALVSTKGNMLGTVDKPTVLQVAKKLEEYLPELQAGLSERAIRERITKGIKLLSE